MSATILKNQRGQGVTEAVMIIVLLFGMTFFIANFFKDQEIIKQLIQGPWQNLAGLLQNGVWAPPEAGAISHPNAHIRHIAIQGDPQ